MQNSPKPNSALLRAREAFLHAFLVWYEQWKAWKMKRNEFPEAMAKIRAAQKTLLSTMSTRVKAECRVELIYASQDTVLKQRSIDTAKLAITELNQAEEKPDEAMMMAALQQLYGAHDSSKQSYYEGLVAKAERTCEFWEVEKAHFKAWTEERTTVEDKETEVTITTTTGGDPPLPRKVSFGFCWKREREGGRGGGGRKGERKGGRKAEREGEREVGTDMEVDGQAERLKGREACNPKSYRAPPQKQNSQRHCRHHTSPRARRQPIAPPNLHVILIELQRLLEVKAEEAKLDLEMERAQGRVAEAQMEVSLRSVEEMATRLWNNKKIDARMGKKKAEAIRSEMYACFEQLKVERRQSHDECYRTSRAVSRRILSSVYLKQMAMREKREAKRKAFLEKFLKPPETVSTEEKIRQKIRAQRNMRNRPAKVKVVVIPEEKA